MNIVCRSGDNCKVNNTASVYYDYHQYLCIYSLHFKIIMSNVEYISTHKNGEYLIFNIYYFRIDKTIKILEVF